MDKENLFIADDAASELIYGKKEMSNPMQARVAAILKNSFGDYDGDGIPIINQAATEIMVEIEKAIPPYEHNIRNKYLTGEIDGDGRRELECRNEVIAEIRQALGLEKETK